MLSAAARRALTRQPWPGNVRELRHVVERAGVLQREGVIDTPHLGLGDDEAAAVPRAGPPWHCIEREVLQRALERSHGNVTAAARSLGLSRDTMRYRIARHRLAGHGSAWLGGDGG